MLFLQQSLFLVHFEITCAVNYICIIFSPDKPLLSSSESRMSFIASLIFSFLIAALVNSSGSFPTNTCFNISNILLVGGRVSMMRNINAFMKRCTWLLVRICGREQCWYACCSRNFNFTISHVVIHDVLWLEPFTYLRQFIIQSLLL